MPAADAAHVGAVVSKGGRAMLRRAFLGADERQIDSCCRAFSKFIRKPWRRTHEPIRGVDALIDELERRQVKWGIVTNKPGWLARSLSAELKLDTRHAALVSGDCLPQKKPEPEPILYACELAGVAPNRSVYVGDDARDIEAGRRAGTMTVAVSWGYLAGEDPHAWQADLVIATPAELLPALGL